MVVLLWLSRTGANPTLRTVVGVVLGLSGVGVLALHGGGAGGQSINPLAFLLIISSGLWAWGSLYAQRTQQASSPLMATAVQMLVGGAVLLVAAIVAGETRGLDVASISSKSLLALAYLIIFGSIIGYSSYTWLLRHAPPALASTYAYVNPVVAVLLGWAFDNDTVTIWTLISSAIIISSVVLITFPRRKPAAPIAPVEQPHAVSAPGESYAGANLG
jgi:drug/metabolite transporter (DMT)-like permease